MGGWKDLYTEILEQEHMEKNATGSEYEKWVNNKEDE